MQNLIRYYILGSLGVANVDGGMCIVYLCMCVFVYVCMWCDVYVPDGKTIIHNQGSGLGGGRSGAKWAIIPILHSAANTQPPIFADIGSSHLLFKSFCS